MNYNNNYPFPLEEGEVLFSGIKNGAQESGTRYSLSYSLKREGKRAIIPRDAIPFLSKLGFEIQSHWNRDTHELGNRAGYEIFYESKSRPVSPRILAFVEGNLKNGHFKSQLQANYLEGETE